MRWSSPQSMPLACAIALVLGTDHTQAATISVTTGGDAGSASTCTLRQAIESANNDGAGTSSCVAGSGADTIVFASNLTDATITLGGSQLSVTQDLTISGSGQTIDANQLSRVLYAYAATMAAANLTLTGGKTTGTGPDAAGAGFRSYATDVTLSDVHITNNVASGAGGGAYGFSGSLTLTNSTISGNSATGNGGGVAFYSGALNLSKSVVSGNTGALAGGIDVGVAAQANTVSIYRSAVTNNTAVCGNYFCTGGMYGAGGSVSVIDSTISGNTANGAGHRFASGGAYFLSATATLVNTTVTGNSASADDDVAGALSESHSLTAGFGGLTLINCTVASNSATKTDPAGTVVAGGVLSGFYSAYNGTVVLANTILAANTPANSDFIAGANATASATFSLLGTALDINPFNAVANKNVFSDAPGLGPLQNNGGLTQTLALLAASPAIDKGSDALAQANGKALAYDERGPGHPRVFGAAVDIGAFEYAADDIFNGQFEAGP